MDASIQTTSQTSPVVYSSDPAAIAAAEQARAQIQTAFLVAMQRPRDTMQARDRILSACKRPSFADKVFYSKPVGGKAIIGPSVRFAEEMIRAWGNVLTQTQVIYEDDDVLRVRVTCIDLESNSQHSKEMQIRKVVERKSEADRDVLEKRRNSKGDVVFIVRATEDEIHNKVASAISKAIRNEGLRLIPADIVSDALNTADETLARSDAEDPKTKLKTICDSFAQIGIKPKYLAELLGHSLDEPVTPYELKELRGTYTAISSGETTWAEVIACKRVSAVDTTAGSGTASLKAKVGAATAETAGPAVPDDQTPATSSVRSRDDLLAKVAEARALKHLDNVAKKYRTVAQDLGCYDDFALAVEDRRTQLEGGSRD